MTYQPIPQETEGGKKEASVSDDDVRQILSHILKELKILNIHMSLITDTLITRGEVE